MRFNAHARVMVAKSLTPLSSVATQGMKHRRCDACVADNDIDSDSGMNNCTCNYTEWYGGRNGEQTICNIR